MFWFHNCRIGHRNFACGIPLQEMKQKGKKKKWLAAVQFQKQVRSEM